MKREMSQRYGIKQHARTDRHRSYSKQAKYDNQKQKREDKHTDRCGNTGRQKCRAKGSGRDVTVQQYNLSAPEFGI
jgi:hypothetical protein